MSKVYISYSCQDREIAEAVARELEVKPCSVWWDRKIDVGTRYDHAIEQELKNATVVLVLWSKNSLDSEWVANEASVALKRNTLFQVLLGGVDPPLEFLRRQAVRVVTRPRDKFCESLSAALDQVLQASKRKQSVISERLPQGDWRFAGGFRTDDRLLNLLPTEKPVRQTRYELCRNAMSQLTSQHVKERSKEVFGLFTSSTNVIELPEQQDAETALLLAHELAEQYGQFGRTLRARQADKSKGKPIPVPVHFNRVYLNTVNTFLKDILKIVPSRDLSERLEISAREADIAAALRHIVKVARVQPRRTAANKLVVGPETHAVYTLGRMRPNLPFMAIQDMLAKFGEKLSKQLAAQSQQRDDFARQLRLMRRTVLLSRTTLGDRDSLKRYITLIHNTFLEADINAGFHLEYYCDQARDEHIPLCSRDEGTDCQKTLQQLTSSLTRALSGGLSRKAPPLYLVETFTLASIIARRLHGQYDEVVSQALPVIEKLHTRIEDEDTRIFLELLLDVASSERDFPDREYGRYMAAKNAPRNGWINSGVKFPESVGSHTSSLLWLCRRLPQQEYPNLNVSRVRAILEIHDIAEGITSDIVDLGPRDAIEKVERTLMRRFSWLGLYMDPRIDLFDSYNLYAEFTAQQTLEAKVAKDIDRLDILLQGWSLLRSNASFDRDAVTAMLERTESHIGTDEVKSILPKVRVMNILTEESFRTTPDSPVKEYYFPRPEQPR